MSKKFSKDELYALPIEELIDFSFDEKTVAVFPDMINRSVPGYSLMQSLTGLIANQSVTKNSCVYDLGCSLGASSLAVLNSVEHHDYELILVDQSQSMIEHCQQFLDGSEGNVVTYFQQKDIRQIEINNASLVMLNLVLQFLPIEDRQGVIDNIYKGLINKGVLLISEKIVPEAEKEKQSINDLYVEFKKRSGYSDLEIGQKRQALENVMRVESINMHSQRLKNTGFSQVISVMQVLNFVTLLAIK